MEMRTGMKTSLGLAVWCVLGMQLVCTGTAFSQATEFFVAPGGNDQWSGRLATPSAAENDGPLATLKAARDRVRKEISKGLSAPVSVQIRGGEYAMDTTVVFGPEDSGTKEAPITYGAYGDEKPVFTGGMKLTGWKKVSADPEGVSKAASGRLWYCDIPSKPRGKWQITSLYDGTTLLKRSGSAELRTSDKQVLDHSNNQPKKFSPTKHLPPGVSVADFSRQFCYKSEDLKNWENLPDIELFLSPKNGWLINYLPLATIDTASKTATYGIYSTYGIGPDAKYFVENAMDYLDQPGEWVFNSKEGRVYFWPERPVNEMDIRAPLLQEFIRVEGIEDQKHVRFLHFTGLTFRHGLRDTWVEGDRAIQHDWEMYDKGNAILRFRHAEDSSVKNCTFEASSGTGVRLDLHCQRIAVTDSLFAHLGGTGILLSGYAPGTKDENKYNTVSNNYLHHIGTLYTHSPAIFIAQSGHNLISHNTIHDLGYNGIVISGCRPKFITYHEILQNRREWVNSLRMDEIKAALGVEITPETRLTIDDLEPLFHARENTIEYNEIYRVMLELHDGNGIYFSGMGNNNVARRNFLHDISGDRGYIRLDDHSGPTKIIENVGLRTSMAFVMKGPGEYRNNFNIDQVRMTNKRWAETHLDHMVFYSTPEKKANLGKKDKESGRTSHIFDAFERVSNSLIFSPRSLGKDRLGKDLIAPGRRGRAEVGMLYADPMFDEEAFAQKIFRFKPGSPAEKLGIKPIDLSKVGSTLAAR
jgi:hypothetical protein